MSPHQSGGRHNKDISIFSIGSHLGWRFGFMVFNVPFNNISVILWLLDGKWCCKTQLWIGPPKNNLSKVWFNLAWRKREYFHFFFQNQLTGNLHIFIKIHHVSVKLLTYEILLIKMQLQKLLKNSAHLVEKWLCMFTPYYLFMVTTAMLDDLWDHQFWNQTPRWAKNEYILRK